MTSFLIELYYILASIICMFFTISTFVNIASFMDKQPVEIGGIFASLLAVLIIMAPICIILLYQFF